MTLTEFLLARIAEDEKSAMECKEWSDCYACPTHERFDHMRIFAECEARRQIVELHTGEHECVGIKHGRKDCVLVAPGFMFELDPTLLLLALPYADHPDYDESWRP